MSEKRVQEETKNDDSEKEIVPRKKKTSVSLKKKQALIGTLFNRESENVNVSGTNSNIKNSPKKINRKLKRLENQDAAEEPA